MLFFSKKFWDSILCKVVTTLTSVKVWVLFGTFFIASWIIKIAIIYEQWSIISNALTLIAAIVGVVVVMREGFKISSLKNHSKKEDTNLNA